MKTFTWRRPGARGDLIASLNLVHNFKQKHGADTKLVYLCEEHHGQTLKDLFHTMGLAGVELGGPWKFQGIPIDLIGYPVKWNVKNPGNHPNEPMKKHLVEYFADELEVPADFENFKLQRPTFNVSGKYITIQPCAGWSPYKNWAIDKWRELGRLLHNIKIPAIQIGGPNDPDIGLKMRIQGPNPTLIFNTCITAIAHAKLHVGVDSWANHATNIKWGEDERRTPGIILWGSSHVLGTGYAWNTNIVKGLSCQPCFKEDPKMKGWNGLPPCDKIPTGKCMDEISVKEVLEKILEKWES